MDEEECEVYPIAGLGWGLELGQKGFVVFCKTRACNVKFYKWFMNDIYVPFVRQLRLHGELAPDAPAYFSLDGEPDQIEMFKDQDIIDLCNENNIVIGKPPASTTEITQQLDAYNYFKSPKTRLKYITDRDVQDDELLLAKLQTIVREQEQKYISVGKFKQGYLKQCSYGILRCHTALLLSQNPNTIKKSFAVTGLYPFNIPQIMNQFRCDVTTILFQKINSALPDLLRYFRRHGEISHDQFVKYDIAPYEASKDHLVIYRHLSCVLTNNDLIEREAARAEFKKNQEAIEAEARRIRADPVERDRRKREKEEDAIRAREAKSAEKERKAAEKAQVTAAKIAAKEEEKKRKLEAKEAGKIARQRTNA